MALVKRKQPPCSVAVRDHDDAQVGESRVDLVISTLEIEDGPVIIRVETGDGETTGGEVL